MRQNIVFTHFCVRFLVIHVQMYICITVTCLSTSVNIYCWLSCESLSRKVWNAMLSIILDYGWLWNSLSLSTLRWSSSPGWPTAAGHITTAKWTTGGALEVCGPGPCHQVGDFNCGIIKSMPCCTHRFHRTIRQWDRTVKRCWCPRGGPLSSIPSDAKAIHVPLSGWHLLSP